MGLDAVITKQRGNPTNVAVIEFLPKRVEWYMFFRTRQQPERSKKRWMETLEPMVLMSATPNEWGVYVLTPGDDVVQPTAVDSWVTDTLLGTGRDTLDGGGGIDTYQQWNLASTLSLIHI